MDIKIALAGNPNCGKTTMFNSLTGSTQYVGNWPGVTVEKKEGRLLNMQDAVLQDLPGIYSLSPYSPEEVITRRYLTEERPDAIINIADATNIERNLYLTTQLLELGIPVVLALNMMDLVKKQGGSIDTAKLSRAVGCEVVETSALYGTGSCLASKVAYDLAKNGSAVAAKKIFSPELEKFIDRISEIAAPYVRGTYLRWAAIKLFERDAEVFSMLALRKNEISKIDGIIKEAELIFDDESDSIIANARYTYIEKLMAQCAIKRRVEEATFSDKIDNIVTNRFLALPIFALIIFLVYYVSISGLGGAASDWVANTLFGDIVPRAALYILQEISVPAWVSALIVDGIIAGVGSVLSFLPQMAILFLFLSFLEDCGYMSRIAFILDRLFKKFGLSGKSLIPMLIATGCSVPAIMSSRTIEGESDRKMTIITSSFIPCGAKLPIISMIAASLFGGSPLVACSAYFIGIASVAVSGIILKKTRGFAAAPVPFLMELPAYHMPKMKNLILHTWDRTKSFAKKAGTVILAACIVIWFLSNLDTSLRLVSTEHSILAALGSIISPLFAPLGWGDWQSVVAAITGLVAKENVVGTLAVLHGVSEDAGLSTVLSGIYSPIAGYSFLLFNLLCAPCIAAMAAIRREMNSARYTAFAILYQTGFAYAVSFCVYRLGMFFAGGAFSLMTAAAFAVAALFIYLILRPRTKPLTYYQEPLNYASCNSCSSCPYSGKCH